MQVDWCTSSIFFHYIDSYDTNDHSVKQMLVRTREQVSLHRSMKAKRQNFVDISSSADVPHEISGLRNK
jgi:hypothetical protein